MNRFFPEGALLDTPDNQRLIQSPAALAEASMEGRVVEARAVLCDAEHNLHVEMPCMEGIIPYMEGAIGIAEGTTRDIALISRVSKPISFLVQGFEHQPDGSRRAVHIRKEEGEDLGLEFETYLMDRARSCANNCIFCFVDQMPKGIDRKSTRLNSSHKTESRMPSSA